MNELFILLAQELDAKINPDFAAWLAMRSLLARFAKGMH